MDGVSGANCNTPSGLGEALLDEVAAHVSYALEKLGVASKEARALLGADVALELARAWGGQMIYVPKGRKHRVMQMHEQVWNEFDGHNHARLAGKYGLSIVTIYKIISRQRELNLQTKQGRLDLLE